MLIKVEANETNSTMLMLLKGIKIAATTGCKTP